ncbi:hypothetical protein ACVXG8_17820 [Escherichia coli]
MRSVAGDPPCSSVVALCLQELQRGLNAPFTLRQIDEAEFEQRLNAVWQRDSSEARQLMEDSRFCRGLFYPRGRTAGNEMICWKATTMRHHQTDQRHAGRGNQRRRFGYPH